MHSRSVRGDESRPQQISQVMYQHAQREPQPFESHNEYTTLIRINRVDLYHHTNSLITVQYCRIEQCLIFTGADLAASHICRRADLQLMINDRFVLDIADEHAVPRLTS